MQPSCDMTYWLIIFLIVAAFANQVELVLRLLLWRRAGGSVHQRAGPRVGSRRALRVSPKSSWSSRGPPRCLSRLKRFKRYQLIQSTDQAPCGQIQRLHLQDELP